MSLTTLKLVRLIGPGFLILAFAAMLGAVTELWNIPMPDYEKAIYAPSLIVPGLMYYITPLRSWVNNPHHKRLVERIRSELVSISGFADRPDKFTWRALKPLFFSLVDSDQTLKKKSELAYFNGAIWTTCADITALSLIYLLIAIAMWFALVIEGALLAAGLFFGLAIIGLLGSLVTTRKQIDIASEQLDVIKYKYTTDVERRIIDLDR